MSRFSRTRVRREARRGLACQFELWELASARRRFVHEDAVCEEMSGSVIFLRDGRIAFADEVHPAGPSRLSIMDREGSVLVQRDLPNEKAIYAVGELPWSGLLVNHRSASGEWTLEVFDPETLSSHIVAVGYRPVALRAASLLLANQHEVIEVDENLDRRVVLELSADWN